MKCLLEAGAFLSTPVSNLSVISTLAVTRDTVVTRCTAHHTNVLQIISYRIKLIQANHAWDATRDRKRKWVEEWNCGRSRMDMGTERNRRKDGGRMFHLSEHLDAASTTLTGYQTMLHPWDFLKAIFWKTFYLCAWIVPNGYFALVNQASIRCSLDLFVHLSIFSILPSFSFYFFSFFG